MFEKEFDSEKGFDNDFVNFEEIQKEREKKANKNKKKDEILCKIRVQERLKKIRDKIGDYWYIYGTNVPIEMGRIPHIDGENSILFWMTNLDTHVQGSENFVQTEINVPKINWQTKEEWKEKYAEKRDDGEWYYKTNYIVHKKGKEREQILL